MESNYGSLTRWGASNHQEEWASPRDWRESKEMFLSVPGSDLKWSILVDNETGEVVARYTEAEGFA